ncbi:TRAP transporter small permease subunit [Rhizobiaceae bacterium BDR2-2]|uniref:TRAP transporter small permease protein n=1 Tax=Ectorhizobium quercum TaxID=2965071 RepID=A0AAE3N130_9HYPH|nr:TRAP transporter small permease subunit [Ectorhizobium quercum]MCX8996857.1 TRAP transporter small permease subunit [Ectorhizobium quercum]
MRYILALCRAVDRVTETVGKSVAWLLLAAVLISASNAVVRKAFNISSNAWLELQWYLFATVFLMGAAYALLRNTHVRIDILSSSFRKRTRDVIDLVLHILFLLPFAGLMVYLAWPWFWKSYALGEVSSNAGGLVLWPAKLLVVLGFGLLFVQAVSEIVKRYAILTGRMEDPAVAQTTAAAGTEQ